MAAATGSSAAALQTLKTWRVFGGTLSQLTHESLTTRTSMRFSIFMPPCVTAAGAAGAAATPVPVLYYLSGLTCTDENFVQKAGAFGTAAELGIAIVAPDTSPRGANIEGEDESYDFGSGAGFYLNATQEPWSQNYNMYDYIVSELPDLVNANFPVRADRVAVMGHSMGGHGALTIALKNPDKFRSVSAFSPIVNPCDTPWGIKAFTGYLGDSEEARENEWPKYDATRLMRAHGPFASYDDILIDQGTSDDFVPNELQPETFVDACEEKGQKVTLRMQDGYDHSYFFISTFMEDHIRWHAERLA